MNDCPEVSDDCSTSSEQLPFDGEKFIDGWVHHKINFIVHDNSLTNGKDIVIVDRYESWTEKRDRDYWFEIEIEI